MLHLLFLIWDSLSFISVRVNHSFSYLSSRWFLRRMLIRRRQARMGIHLQHTCWWIVWSTSSSSLITSQISVPSEAASPSTSQLSCVVWFDLSLESWSIFSALMNDERIVCDRSYAESTALIFVYWYVYEFICSLLFVKRFYFAVASNAQEQLFYFGSLISWLLSLVGHKFNAPDQVFLGEAVHPFPSFFDFLFWFTSSSFLCFLFSSFLKKEHCVEISSHVIDCSPHLVVLVSRSVHALSASMTTQTLSRQPSW